MKEHSLRRISDKAAPRTVLDTETIIQNKGVVHLQPGDRVTVGITAGDDFEKVRVTLREPHQAYVRDVYQNSFNLYPKAILSLENPDLEEEFRTNTLEAAQIVDLATATPLDIPLTESEENTLDKIVEKSEQSELQWQLEQYESARRFLESEPDVQTDKDVMAIEVLHIYAPITRYTNTKEIGV
jgi:hypothetical protein